MEKVTSADGTTIAFSRAGSGSPLVLVHGTGGSASRWQPLVPKLSERFTVLSVDRRGRGESGDKVTYTLEREVDDLLAVIETAGSSVNLLGHSYGAIVSAEAALRTDRLQGLILYEPPIPTHAGLPFPAGVIPEMETKLAAGDREGLLAIFFLKVAGLTEEELTLLQTQPSWPARLAAAHTIFRELQTVRNYEFQPKRFRDLKVPALILLGGDSPHIYREAAEALAATLPNGRLTVLPGQRHTAMDTAPDLFLKEVIGFLSKH